MSTTATQPTSYQTATLGGGCFWCLDSAFSEVNGVIHTESGYAGGHMPNPTYQQICSGTSGHAEVVRLTFDPAIISYREILEIFFALHDPTQLNRQGNDVGPQYRSVVFFHDNTQRDEAATLIAQMTADEIWSNPVVTAVEEVSSYHPAEEYHNGYYEKNSDQPYCAMVISPKLAKFRATFARHLK